MKYTTPYHIGKKTTETRQWTIKGKAREEYPE